MRAVFRNGGSFLVGFCVRHAFILFYAGFAHDDSSLWSRKNASQSFNDYGREYLGGDYGNGRVGQHLFIGATKQAPIRTAAVLWFDNVPGYAGLIRSRCRCSMESHRAVRFLCG